jgi:beta-lactamase class A
MKAHLLHALFLFIFSSYFYNCHAQNDSLRDKIEAIINSNKGNIGVAINSIEDNDSLTFNNHLHYPMQSVFKFHLALAVLNQVDKGKFSLDQNIYINKKDLMVNTWSPIRDKYPKGNINLPLREIIKYTVSLSDNNGCDILFKLVGGPKEVNKFIHKLGIKENEIVANEAAMHKDFNVQFSNWTTPFAAVELLQLFHSGKILSKESNDFLYKTMIETSTGPKRMKGMLPADAVVAHKTGSGDTDKYGNVTATNDIGIIRLPNGKHVAIAVFVSNSPADDTIREAIIAQITKAAWDFYSNK